MRIIRRPLKNRNKARTKLLFDFQLMSSASKSLCFKCVVSINKETYNFTFFESKQKNRKNKSGSIGRKYDNIFTYCIFT